MALSIIFLMFLKINFCLASSLSLKAIPDKNLLIENLIRAFGVSNKKLINFL